MDQKDFERRRSAQLNALKAQAEKMYILNWIENQQRFCTDDCGCLDKEKLMLYVGFFLILSSGKDGFCINGFGESIKDVNRFLREILGKGHSFVSCVQFIQGKRGQQVLRRSIGDWCCRRGAYMKFKEQSSN